LDGVFIVKFNIENNIRSECRIEGLEEKGRGRWMGRKRVSNGIEERRVG